MSAVQPIPVTIITGSLGAGKTSLLNHILQHTQGLRAAVLVNDFGEINIDAQLVVGVESNTVALSNGCICCTIRDDLLMTVLDLVARPERPEYILIETSGVSDPVSIALTFMLPELRPYVVVDSILTVIDCEQLPSLEGENAILADLQIRSADMVVLNKIDLVEETKLEELRLLVRRIAPDRRIFETTLGKIPLELAIGVGRFDADSLARQAQDIHVHAEKESTSEVHKNETEAEMPHSHDPDHSLVFSTWSFVNNHPLDLEPLQHVVKTLPPNIYRMKGVLFFAEAPTRKAILHVVGNRVRLTIGDPCGNEPQCSQLVVIGSYGSIDAEDLRRRFESALLRMPLHGLLKTPRVVEWFRARLASDG